MKLGRTIICGLAIGLFSAGALAQDQQQPARGGGQRQPGGPREGGPGGPGGFGGRQLSLEKAKAAWTAQASGVAARLGLNADQTKAVVSAYTAARESQGTAADKLREEAMQQMRDNGAGPEGMRDMMKKVDELNATEREKLQKALTSAIGADATAKAMTSLGTFNRQWDNLVDVFSTFQLDAAKQQQGFNAIEDFSVASAAAQAKMRANRGNEGGQGGQGGPGGQGGGDREAMRAAAQEGRQKLLDSLKPLLNKEQLTKMEEALPGAGRGPGGGGGRRGGGGGGGGGN